MYGENTKHHSNPYIQGTTVPCDSLVVKGLNLINLITFVGMSALLVIIQPTYIGLVSLYG